MGAADIATVLFRDVLKFDAADPQWPDRDRFVLSAGHGSMLLYSLLYLTGVGGDKGLTIDDLKTFRQLGSKTPGHPEYGHTHRRRDDDRTARAGHRDRGRHGARRADARRRIRRHRRSPHLCARLRRRPDGRRQPGGDRHRRPSQAVEADRPLRRQRHFDRRQDFARPIRSTRSRRFRSAGWNAVAIDGHDPEAILRAIARRQKRRPADDDRLQDDDRLRRADARRHQQGAWRGARRGRDRRRAQGLELALRAVRRAGRHSRRLARRRGARQARSATRGSARSQARPPSCAPSSSAACAAICRRASTRSIDAYKRKLAADAPEIATRKAGEAALKVIAPAVPELVTGSADLTALDQHQGRGDARDHARRHVGPLHPLGHSRAWHGGGLQRHGAARGLHSRRAPASSSSPTIAAPRCGSRR